MSVRFSALALLAISGLAIRLTDSLVLTLPQHQPNAAEMLLALVAVLAGFSGAACLFIGPALFRAYRWPPQEVAAGRRAHELPGSGAYSPRPLVRRSIAIRGDAASAAGGSRHLGQGQ